MLNKAAEQLENKKELVRSIASIVTIVFVAEVLVMAILSGVHIENAYFEMLIDGFLLSVFSTPLIYWFVVKRNFEKNRKLADDLWKTNNYLQLGVLISEGDLQGRITYANLKFCEISKYTEEELLGKPHNLINSGHHPKEFWKHFWSTIKSGKVWTGEVCNKAKDGSLYWVQSSVVPLSNSRGEITGYGSIRHDITEKKQTQENLERAAKMAALGGLSAGLAHEINNPLAVAKGYTQFIKKQISQIESPQKSGILLFVDKLNHSLDRINKITDSMVVFTKERSKKQNLDEQPSVEVTSLISDVYGAYAEKLQAMGIELKFKKPEELLHVAGEASNIQQIFAKLLDNARDAVSDSVIKNIHLEISNAGSSKIEVKVKDSGTGIDDEVKGKIFEPFFTTKEVGEGVGLGLFTVLAFVEELGGEISFESKPGEGACFTVRIPKSAYSDQSRLDDPKAS